MTRPAPQILDDIRAFEPVGGNWRRLDDLFGDLWATGTADQYVPDLLAVLERFPEGDGAGVLWSIVHGVESLPRYEAELIRSVRRKASEMGVTMIGRLLNGGVTHVDGISLVGLLRDIAESMAASPRSRELAATWIARQSGEDPQ